MKHMVSFFDVIPVTCIPGNQTHHTYFLLQKPIRADQHKGTRPAASNLSGQMLPLWNPSSRILTYGVNNWHSRLRSALAMPSTYNHACLHIPSRSLRQSNQQPQEPTACGLGPTAGHSVPRHCPREDKNPTRETQNSATISMSNLLPSSGNNTDGFSFWNSPLLRPDSHSVHQ